MKTRNYKEFKHAFTFNDENWEHLMIVSNIADDDGEFILLDQKIVFESNGNKATIHGNLQITPEKLRQMANELEQSLFRGY